MDFHTHRRARFAHMGECLRLGGSPGSREGEGEGEGFAGPGSKFSSSLITRTAIK